MDATIGITFGNLAMHSGENMRYISFLHRGERISVITAVSIDGVVAYELHKGTVSGDKFLDFVHGSLIPIMLPYFDDGLNPCSIVAMNNCSINQYWMHLTKLVSLFFFATLQPRHESGRKRLQLR